MQKRNFKLRWTLILAAVAMAAAFTFFVSRNNGEAPAHKQAITQQPDRTSQVLGSREYRGAPAATLEQSLVAADLLVRAGKLPSLMESLQAADLLVKAGKLAPPPTLAQSLEAADVLVKAGAIEAPQPSLAESMVAADELRKAGVTAPPAPPLIDILRAASILADAKATAAGEPAQDTAPPAPAATNTPQPPAPTNTPKPATSTPVPATNTPAPAPKSTEPANINGGHFDDDFTAEVLAQVNARRKTAGLQPLSYEPRLANSAATYAKVLADNNWFSHTGPDGSTLVTRDEAAGFPFTVQLGEVLAWGSDGWTPSEIVQAWIDSPAHKEQILNAAYTRAGAGCYFTTEGSVMVRCAMELAAAD